VGAIVFRCDGDDEVGAGHVARCLQVAAAMRAAGDEVAIAGTVSGVAAGLVEAAGLDVVEPQPDAPAGVPAAAEAAVVDSYAITGAEIEAAAALRPLAVVLDDGPVPRCAAALVYHLDAGRRIEPGDGVIAIFGPAYAPVHPGCVAARRERGFQTALVTLGGSHAGRALLEPLADSLLALDPALELFVAGSAALAPRDRVQAGLVPGGLLDRIAAADVAVSGAGSTPYDLACAGVPSLLVALADNQAPVGAAFEAAGIALFADARAGLTAERAAEAVAPLADPAERERLATAGPAAIDGYGAFRAAAALRAAFDGTPLPRVVRYRPATRSDAERLLGWRNDPATRTGSRQQHEVGPAEHEEWLARSLADPARAILIAELPVGPAATVRFDRDGDEAEIGITVAPEARGEGVGAQVIREASELHLHAHPEVRRIRAEVRTDNARSAAAFERAGFARRADDGEFAVFEADAGSLGRAGRG
jgi:spore coat polysaccharide biosynthesis predicted glycosyltransferase SpsG/RimJ/RimL family protein N-acetyltransferase